MYDPTLRKFGYLVDARQRSPLLAMAERAALRPRPLNRLYPRDGHWVMVCPICAAEDAAWVEPDQATWTAACAPGSVLSIFELHAVLLGSAA